MDSELLKQLINEVRAVTHALNVIAGLLVTLVMLKAFRG